MGMSTIAPSNQPTSGKGGGTITSSTSNQAQFGQPSQYSNTIPQANQNAGWDNATIGSISNQSGKSGSSIDQSGGKGGGKGSGWQPFNAQWTPPQSILEQEAAARVAQSALPQRNIQYNSIDNGGNDSYGGGYGGGYSGDGGGNPGGSGTDSNGSGYA